VQVPFLRKSAPSPAEALEPAPAATQTVGAPKGRPTPKRRDSVRRPAGPAVKAPRTRKEAVAWQKQARKNSLAAADPKMDKVQYRAAMKAGDERVLTSRDRGPVKALARDYVDSRRMLANYLFALLPLVILSTAVPALAVFSAFSMVLLIVITIEAFFTGRRIRKIALERLDQVPNSGASLGFYAVSRASMPRRWRLPAARVSVGAEI
jgi:hypothetical protein